MINNDYTWYNICSVWVLDIAYHLLFHCMLRCVTICMHVTFCKSGLWQLLQYNYQCIKRGELIVSCNSKCCGVQRSIVTNSVVYQCMNMDITDSESYNGYVLISRGQNHVEWCTPTVIIIARNCSVGESQHYVLLVFY